MERKKKENLKLVKGTRAISLLFIIFSVMITAGVMFAANMYYDLDLNINGSITPGIVTEEPLSLGNSSSAGELVINNGNNAAPHQLIFKASSNMEENTTYIWPTNIEDNVSGYRVLAFTNTGNNATEAQLVWTSISGVGGVSTDNKAKVGDIAFFTGSADITGRDTFYWDRYATRLGINTAGSPLSQLDIREAYFDIVERYDGTNYNDDTAESKTIDGTAYEILTSTSDQFYVGFSEPFSKIYFDLDTAGGGITLTAEYSQGSGNWGSLSITDGTNNLSQDGTISFSVPSDWGEDTVNGSTKYWVRLTTSTSPTTIPTAFVTLRDDSSGVLAVYSNGGTSPTLRVGTDGKLYFKSYPLAYSGKQVLREMIPIMGFDLPVQTSSGSFVNVSRVIKGNPFTTEWSGTTRRYKFIIRYADEFTSGDINWNVKDLDTGNGDDSVSFTTPVSPDSDLTTGVVRIAQVDISNLMNNGDSWQLQVHTDGTNHIRIYQIFLAAYDEIQ